VTKYNCWVKRYLLISIISLFLCHFSAAPASAIVDPLGVPNNRVGVHILAPEEVGSASKLVNSNGGDWGYVTVPMRSDDRDPAKWVKFFNECKSKHLIPIIRIATYPQGSNWVVPDSYDLVDFANFLNDMPWPTKNRYVILFNEPNHSNEWGGQVDPFEYARLLVNAGRIFKERSPDFFLITAGLDMSVPNSTTSTEALKFYSQMTDLLPDWHNWVDGLSVHAYPNPGFSASVYSASKVGITSYRYELKHLQKMGISTKPIFITETGYIGDSEFYTPAFNQVWTEPQIVAITPFILFAGTGPFEKFSLLNSNHLPKKSYLDILELNKITGSPLLSNITIGPAIGSSTDSQPYTSTLTDKIKSFWSLFRTRSHLETVQIGKTQIEIETANTESSRQRGLSGRKELPQNQGLLFVFPHEANHSFWMKDMNFALDFIWLRQGKIVELTENVPPPSQMNNQPAIITPKEPVDQVLEVNAGFIKLHNITIGQILVY
jgi:uncharacterized membrane protein (UPF0127 family)